MADVVMRVNEAFGGALDCPLPLTGSGPSNIRIGKRLRIRRSYLGISAREFAKRLGIGLNDLHLYETGEKRVSAKLLLRITKLLDVRLEHFFVETTKE